MLRSMYSGISGLRNFQTKLDVIGNNIANVNTYGFKKGRTIFKDLISQTVAGASGATPTRGGVNPKQIGLGSQISAIDTLHTSGSTQFTGNTLDLAISGDGFFQVADGLFGQITARDNGSVILPDHYNDILFSRAGNFYMDSDGYLVNADGKYLVGYSGEIIESVNANDNTYNYIYLEQKDVASLNVDPRNPNNQVFINDNGTSNTNDDYFATYRPIRIPTDAQSMNIGQDGTITFVDAGGTLRWAGQIIMAKFPNTGGLAKSGGNYFSETSNSGNPVYGTATTTGLGSINSGFLEMSNVDLAEEFTEMIVAQRGFQANTRIITTSDEILQELVNLKR